MCGIIGFSGNNNAITVLLEGLSALEYRGYDSAGVAYFENGSIKAIKAKGKLNCLSKKIDELGEKVYSECGIGHTRWATHGEPTDINSHPHGTENLMLVHNGIIENYISIKENLLKKGYDFVSQTDTECAVKLIDYYYKSTKDPLAAIKKACSEIEGSYAFGIIFNEQPGKIYALRKDSPLIVALSESGNYIASDIPAVLKYTNKYYRLTEGEIAIVEREKVTVLGADLKPVEKEINEANWDIEAAEKGGYPHFMLKEINEESKAIVKTLSPKIKNGLPDFGLSELSDEKLRSFKKIYVIACGTAMHAGFIGKCATEKLARIPVSVEIASEFRYSNPILNKDDLVVIISQSGETADTLAALRLAKESGCHTLAIVNVVGSSIAREADSVLYTHAGPEIAVASTKAYVVQMAVMLLLTIKLAIVHNKIDTAKAKEYVNELINTAPAAVETAIALTEKIKVASAACKDATNLFFLGRGMDYFLAQEASLKLKEISYIHSEAYAAGELKHGTISLVTDGVPVFAFATVDDIFPKTISNIKECKARGGFVVLVCKEGTEVPKDVADYVLELPVLSEIYMPIVAAPVFQLFAYYCALMLERDIDKPRNLAKSVTVE